MVSVREIKFVIRGKSGLAHERIDSICGTDHEGATWKMSVQDAVAGMERGEWKFYISFAGRAAWIHLATSREGVKYLRTEYDYDQPNLLLMLQECPETAPGS